MNVKATVEAKERADYPARTMTRPILLGLLASVVFAGAAQAQMYPGQGITVNTGAINGPGTGYSSPYARNDYPDIIHLHMPAPPVHHHHVAAKPKPADNTVATTAPTETTPPAAAPTSPPPSASPYPPPLDSLTPTDITPPPAPVKHTHHAHASQAAAAPAASPPAPAPAPAPPASDSTGSDAALPLTLDPQAEHPVSKPPKHKHADADKVQKVASAEAPPATAVVTAPASDTNSGLTRRSEILFPRGDPDVSSSTVDRMRAVAADLTTLLGAGASRVQLDAYGGTPGDKSSDARRLSLKRALGVRELLIEDGVPAEKIDVRALGGIDDSGAPDRVDVMVRGG
jgi:outer membrane protein OmpA-like peptidoglycan-associated protein